MPKDQIQWMWVGAIVVAACSSDTSATEAGESSTAAFEDAESESGSSGPEVPGAQFCAGASMVRYDPDGLGIDAWPDDRWTEDADTRTGLRLVSPLSAIDPDDPTAGFGSVFSRMSTLDGFGTTAPIFLRLMGAVDPASLPAPGTEADPATSPLLLVDLDAEVPAFVEYGWRLVEETEGGATLLLAPLRPLRVGARYGVAMTRGVTDTDGGCFAPSPAMRGLLDGTNTDERLARVQDGHAVLLEALRGALAVEAAQDLSAAVVFTTATTLRQSSTIAASIAGSLPSPITFDRCVPLAIPSIQCEGDIQMVDFGDGDGIITGTVPLSTYTLRWTAYVPSGETGPHPTIVFGHALTGDRTSGWIVSSFLVDLGFAVVGIDAPKHGEHPDRSTTNPTFDLLGLSSDGADPFDPFAARDNFRQATFDKLQLMRRIRAGFDATGDGTVDFDSERLHYVGHSLGAVMGPHLLAYSDAFEAATLVVGGANLTNIVEEGSEFKPLIALVTQAFDADERARLLAITQTVMDGGDPMAFAPFVLRDRIEGFDARIPHVLVQMAVDDTIVPNSSTGFLVRALGVPIAGEAHREMRGVEALATTPVQGNLGGTTGALWQFDRMDASGIPVPAMHRELQDDPLAYGQRHAFHGAVLADEVPPIGEPVAR